MEPQTIGIFRPEGMERQFQTNRDVVLLKQAIASSTDASATDIKDSEHRSRRVDDDFEERSRTKRRGGETRRDLPPLRGPEIQRDEDLQQPHAYQRIADGAKETDLTQYHDRGVRCQSKGALRQARARPSPMDVGRVPAGEASSRNEEGYGLDEGLRRGRRDPSFISDGRRASWCSWYHSGQQVGWRGLEVRSRRCVRGC